MEIFENLFRQILNLIKDLLEAFGADTAVVDGLLGELDKAEDKETETV